MEHVFTFPTVFVDIETTGGGYRNSRILEIAAIRVEGGEVVDEFSTLLDPQTYVPRFITNLTGITTADTKGMPTFADIAPRLLELLDGAVFVAHNVTFDYSFIRAEFARLGATFSSKRLCTVRLSRMLYKNQQGHSLEKLIARHDIPYSARHRALDDARAILFFAQLAYEEQGETAFAAAINHQLKSQYTPLGLEQAQLQAIESEPGVYIFKGDDEVVLYVGKSIDMKKRVASHFQDMSAREVKLASKVRSIETIPTGTELLALLLESRLVKALSPIFNIQLRRVSSYCMAVRGDVDGFPTLKLIDGVPDDGSPLDAIYGMYDNRAKAKKWLDIITRTYGLCPKLMGLEKTKGSCFNASLGKCHGACAGRESAEAYATRFETALEKARIATWPYPGPVSVPLEGGGTMTVDNWVITQLDSPVPLTADLTTRRFDLDEYKILRSFFARNPVGLQLLV